jgi:DNA-binding transcriptional LysR family regulator
VEFRQLQYFCAVATAGSFSAGAAQERIAQPSLSVQIRNLEEELGVKLFDRCSRPFVRLTEAG